MLTYAAAILHYTAALRAHTAHILGNTAAMLAYPEFMPYCTAAMLNGSHGWLRDSGIQIHTPNVCPM